MPEGIIIPDFPLQIPDSFFNTIRKNFSSLSVFCS